jgi:HEAT repeat protein
MLLQCFGLVIFRSRTDDLQFEPTAFQRAAANLILRTGESQQLVDLILAQCEGTRRDEDTPEHLRKILADMQPELAPGFIRNDGLTVAQPLAALPHIIRDKQFVPRLINLLDHPAYIVRIYSAEALAALGAQEAVESILRVANTPYPFPDPTSQASGKHFDRSKFVRWRGYVCIALGKLGGEPARIGLEKLATADQSYRDIRYGSTVGLRFLGSPESIPALKQIADNDIIREIRNEATRAIADIQIAQQLAEKANDLK